MPEETSVAVVGGGMAGLAAAYTLHQRGVRFVLLEASERWGGVIRTEFAGGFLLESGPDSFLAQKPAALALCRELGLETRLVPSNTHHRTVFMLRRGRPVAMPEGLAFGVPARLGPLVRNRLVSWRGRLRMALDLALPRRAHGEGDETVAEFFRRRLGEEALTALADPLVSAVHGGDPERLSMASVLPRMRELEERHRSLVLGLWRTARAAAAGPTFYSLEGGLAELVNAIVSRLPAASRRLCERARALRATPAGLELETSGDAVHARAVIVALPPAAAADLLRPLQAEAASLLEGITVAPTVVVHLAYRREDVSHPLDGHGLLVPRSEGLRCVACSFVSTKFPHRAPGGHVLLRAALGGIRDPGVLQLDPRTVPQLVHRELVGPLGLAADPVLTRVQRWPSATPQMERGHAGRVARVEAALRHQPGLFLTGGGLRGVGLPDVIADGRRAAEAAAALAGAG